MDKERNLMFDVLKGLGIISVIFSHVYRGGKDPLAIFIRELAMWCVPMFFMVQGYFMYSPSYKNWFKSSWKKIKKSYIPYLIWALFYGGFYYYTIGKTFTWLDLILGKTALHLYFMFYYIVFAIFVPLLYFLPQLWRRYILIFMILSNLYVNFMLETARRDKFLIRGYEYFEWIWDYLLENGFAQIFLAEHEGDLIAATLAMITGNKVWYLYGASSNNKRSYMPNYLIQWAMIQWAKEKGCSLYDFRGVSGDLDESNPLYGLYRFKKGFGGQMTEFIGEWDQVYSPFFYWLWNNFLPLYQNISRSAKKRGQEE